MRKSLATLIRKLADWLDPQPASPALQGGGGPGSTDD